MPLINFFSVHHSLMCSFSVNGNLPSYFCPFLLAFWLFFQMFQRFLIRSVASRSFNAVRTMRVVPIPALHDNYMYLIVDDQQPKGERLAAIVDPVDVNKIFKTVKEEGAQLQAALVTHHHSDHAGGTAELAKVAAASSSACAGLVKAPLCIYSGDAARVHCTDKVLGDGQTAALGPLLHIQAMYTPCHTSTHVCYYVVDQRTNERAVFTGDTLFVGGCGRFFEGTAEQMHCALNERLAALPDETMVFCGHEYTVANLQFALTVEPSNDTIRRKLDWAMAQRAANKWTVPSTIGEEKRHNVFMRVDSSAEVQRNCGTGPEDPVGTMAKLRERKNSFKG